MEKEEETLRLFRILEKVHSKYLVIGGLAVVLYGVKRATFDIDLAVGQNNSEIELLLNVLAKLGYKEVVSVETNKHIAKIEDIKPADIIKLESVKVINGQPVDILVVPEGTFNFIWEYRVKVVYKDVPIFIPNIVDLIHLKEHAGRPIDIADVGQLRHILRKKNRK